ncbi:response regulator transcription factor [Clostridium massiliamazoniense]|uniref:response regulator transcription factor n=1 Tax=Clostridium massiliamazoniense TaxID=1347366 RepID=UPI0006D7F33D|nr:response regulator transcription factor [Clostridium massiliamazoniense]
MSKNKIFIVEDEEKMVKELILTLNKYGYSTSFSFDFEHIVDCIINDNPHLVLLDINLPYYDGFYICRELRKSSNIPIIVVTSRDSDMDELMSINLGADDFITKPYNTQILLARIGALLKRTYNDNTIETFKLRDLIYNLSTSEAIFSTNKVELTKNESKILYILFQNKGKIVSRDKIIKALWQAEEFVDDNTLTVNINRLRKKLEEIGAKDYLQTKRGQGYILL